MTMLWSKGRDLGAAIRKAALHLSNTPLHPQWFSFRAKRRAAEAVAGHAHGVLLDLGSGDGALSSRLPPGCTYFGLDSMVTGKAMYAAAPAVFADAARLPFRAGSIDVVALLDVLEHLPEADIAVAEIARVLKPGGRVLIHVPCLYPLHDEPFDFQRLTSHGLANLLGRHELRIERLEPRGAPPETVALLFNIALGHCILRMVRKTPVAILLALPLMPVIVAANIIGWLSGLAMRGDGLMPFSYWVVAECSGCRDADEAR